MVKQSNGKAKSASAKKLLLNVAFKLEGDDAARLLRYMEKEKLPASATVARKFVLERLDQIEEQAARG
jgi:hypothetical protein